VIELVDQTFRDGQQSLWGMRLRGGMLRKVAGELTVRASGRWRSPAAR